MQSYIWKNYSVKRSQKRKKIFWHSTLINSEEKIKNAKIELWNVLTSAKQSYEKEPHPLIRCLSFKKGIHIICRALGLVEQKQCLGFFSVMFTRLECLEVCNITLGEKNKAVNFFLETLFPIFSEVISESNFGVIIAMMQIILERHNLLWVANSRVGLEMLTLFLSQAEILKSGGSVNETELAAWGEVFDFIFKSFESQFTELFAKNIEPADEEYIWQFLSALAIGASGIEQQKVLVTELRFLLLIRNNIITTSKLDHPRALENVNLFLKALGLNIDAKQLAAMSK